MRTINVLWISMLLFVSFSCTSRSTEDLRLAETGYEDPKGFFSVTPPQGWRVQEYPNDVRGKVAFFGPRNVELRILTNSVDFSSLDGIIYHAEEMEKKLGISTNIKKTTFNGFPAVERTFLYKGDKLKYVDFLFGSISHNLAYAAPKKRYDEYIGIISLSLATYQPLNKELSEKEKDDNYLSKMRRLGKLLIQQDSYTMALVHCDTNS